jgi:SWIM zinc finger
MQPGGKRMIERPYGWTWELRRCELHDGIWVPEPASEAYTSFSCYEDVAAVTAQEVKQLAARLAKAEALVQDGAVFPVTGLPDYAVVKNGDGTQMYLAQQTIGHEHCSCPDFQHRQGKQGHPCKYILAAEIAAGTTPPDAPGWPRRHDGAARGGLIG